MFGLENEEEFAKRIQADTSLSFEEKRKQLAENLSATAYDKAEEKLFKSIERKGKANKILGAGKKLKAWNTRFKPNAIQNYQATSSVLKNYPKVLRTEQDVADAIINLREGNKIKPGAASTLEKNFKEYLKNEKANYDVRYEYRDMDEVLAGLDAQKDSMLSKLPARKPGVQNLTDLKEVENQYQATLDKLEELQKMSQAISPSAGGQTSQARFDMYKKLYQDLDKLRNRKAQLEKEKEDAELMDILNNFRNQ